ncbi:MAG: YceI family protein, partial [Verrucomicrobiota bacterium]|nr:YceI family protein [Verrucomicrobiota bacterium]
MTPIKTIIKHAAAIIACMFITLPSNAAEYEIESVGSYILFNITHFKVGKAHGRFNDFKGTVTYDPDSPEKSKLDFT